MYLRNVIADGGSTEIHSKLQMADVLDPNRKLVLLIMMTIGFTARLAIVIPQDS